MFPTISRKIFFACCAALLVSPSCGWWRAKTDATATPSLTNELKSEIPFATKEPENFQADFVVTANGAETKTFLARSGDRRRFDFVFGAKNAVTVLQIGAKQNFLILPAGKIFAENFAAQVFVQTSENWKDFLTNKWLYQKADAKFVSLGAENNLAKYSVKLNDGENAEAIVFVDEQINLPVRQEFYTVRGEEKSLSLVFEIRNFKLQTDENLFEIPKDFRRVPPEILRTTLQKEGYGDE